MKQLRAFGSFFFAEFCEKGGSDVSTQTETGVVELGIWQHQNLMPVIGIPQAGWKRVPAVFPVCRRRTGPSYHREYRVGACCVVFQRSGPL